MEIEMYSCTMYIVGRENILIKRGGGGGGNMGYKFKMHHHQQVLYKE